MIKITYLGYILDTEAMSISLPDAKIYKMRILMDGMFHKFETGQKVSAREVATLTGNFAHSIYSHGGFMRCVSRNLNHILGLNVSSFGWDTKFYLNKDVITELEMCDKYLDVFNGIAIRVESVRLDVFFPAQTSYMIEKVSPQMLRNPIEVFFSGKYI